MQSIAQYIKSKTKDYELETLEIFTYLHQHPELSFKEFETSKYIQNKLSEWNIPFKSGYVKTGIVAKIEGKNPKKRIIALRADMDALPIQEHHDEGCIYSLNEGVMHACGHDSHSTALLVAGRILNELKDKFEGTILLVFQPGEEADPGGASLMLKEGALNNPRPDIIIGQHVLVDMPVGHVGYRSGICMASADEVHITIKGKGGHAALPHLLNDTVLAASQVVISLQQIVSRLSPAFVPSVLSFGKFIANGATNVIPEEVKLSGTFRTMDETWRAEAKEHIRRISIKVAEGMGCECECEVRDGYPCVVNDDEVTSNAVKYSKKFLGENNVETMHVRMTAEDFGFYSEQFPSTFFRFGVKSDNYPDAGGLHTPKFRLDPKSLETAISNLAYLSISFLNDNE